MIRELEELAFCLERIFGVEKEYIFGEAVEEKYEKIFPVILD